jgi:hypothetical protein
VLAGGSGIGGSSSGTSGAAAGGLGIGRGLQLSASGVPVLGINALLLVDLL